MAITRNHRNPAHRHHLHHWAPSHRRRPAPDGQDDRAGPAAALRYPQASPATHESQHCRWHAGRV